MRYLINGTINLRNIDRPEPFANPEGTMNTAAEMRSGANDAI